MFGCLAPSISSHASGDVWSSGESYTYFQNHFEDINTRLNGVIINQNGLREDFEDFVDEYRDNYNIPSGTSSSTWIGDNITGNYQNGSSGNADLSFSSTFRQSMRDWCNAYLEANTGYWYAYSFGSADYISYFGSQDAYHQFVDILNSALSNGQQVIVDKYGIYDAPRGIAVLPSGTLFYKTSYVNSTNMYGTTPSYNWNDTIMPDKVYTWSSSAAQYTEGTPSNWYNYYVYFAKELSTPLPSSNGTAYNCCVSVNRSTYIIYKNKDSLQNGSEGIQDYYVTDSYNSSINGSYNTTTSNVENTINSNNVNNYINNYYVENGNYPSPNQINIYINQHINEGSGGGGSGGDNDDDNNNNIWDFLNGIGEFLGNLISSLGEVLTGILSLLTDVIDLFIGEDGLPNIFSQLVSYYLGFLPQEFLSLIELFVVCVLIVGIIKLIRGS